MLKKFTALFFIAISLFLGGCAQIYSDVSINSDQTGTWTAKVFLATPMSENEFRDMLAQKQIADYKLEKISEEIPVSKSDGNKVHQAEGWKVTMDFASTADLTRIVRALEMGGGTPSLIVDKANDFCMVNLGRSTEKVTVRVDGSIIKETVATGKIIDSSTIEFSNGEAISFHFKPATSLFVKILMTLGALLLGAGAYIFYKRRQHQPSESANPSAPIIIDITPEEVTTVETATEETTADSTTAEEITTEKDDDKKESSQE
jgi:hypothetical protein